MGYRTVPIDRLEDIWEQTGGLTADQARERRSKYGANEIVETIPHAWWALVIETLKDPMLWFFAGTSLLYAFVGQSTEALTLLVAIVPLLGMDVFLHRRTQASTASLKSRLATTAVVFRSGSRQSVPSLELVPGDLVQLASGEPIPPEVDPNCWTVFGVG